MKCNPTAPALLAALLACGAAWAHGDVTPQAVDTKELPVLGADWRADNPTARRRRSPRR